MGFFMNYSRPGRGVSKEDANKRNYFDIFGRHFFDLAKLNLLFVLCNVLFIAAAIYFTLPYYTHLDQVLDTLILNKNALLPILPFVPFMFMGPFIAGLTFVLRNWARQEHAFLASDFFEHTKKNWRQGLALSIMSTIVCYLFLTAVIFYLKTVAFKGLVITLAIIIGTVLLAMNMYTYPMIVTFDMKLFDILKNALIFALGKLPQSVFFLVIIGGVHGVLLWYKPTIWLFLMAVILIAWSGFTMNYYAWHVIDKYMMPKDENKEENIFDDII